jgi:hypothetical protein
MQATVQATIFAFLGRCFCFSRISSSIDILLGFISQSTLELASFEFITKGYLD